MDFLMLALNSSIDILITSFIIYFIIKVLLRTEKLILILNAFLLYFLLYFISIVFDLKTVQFLLGGISAWIIIIIVIIFQKEIRDSLEKIGSFSSFFGNEQNSNDDFINELYNSVYSLSKTKTGALITLENEVNLQDYISRAIVINADFSNELINSIFNKESMLHDGAVIVRKNKILCASAFYPIALDLNIDKSLGTRHRAAITISRESDSITIIVSEEKGKISIAYNGKIYQNVKEVFFKEFIKEKYIGE